MDGTLPFAFTWSPNPKIFRGIDPLFQFYDTAPFIDQLATCCSSYIVYPELNLNGNIHYHAKITLKDKVKWYKKVLPTFKYKGFVVVKPKCDEGWLSYIEKDKKLMESLLDLHLPIDRPLRQQLSIAPKGLGVALQESSTLLDFGITIT